MMPHDEEQEHFKNDWMPKVDTELSKVCGLSHNDLPDGPWRDYYMDGFSPKEAIEAYAEDGWDDLGLIDLL